MSVEDMDFAKVSQRLYDQWERGMTAWWDQVLDNPTFLAAVGDNLAALSRTRREAAGAVDEGLAAMHLPNRGDLVRVARIATLLEDKVLALEDRLLAISDQLARIEKEAIAARIEAAEARLELRRRLDALGAHDPDAGPGGGDV